jgi:hypothetical protein
MSNDNKDNKNQLGALWEKISQRGLNFYSGEVVIPEGMKPGEKIQLVLFKNDRKEPGSKQPDWRIYLSDKPTTPTGGGNRAPVAPPNRAPVPARPAAPVGQTRPAPARPPVRPNPAPAAQSPAPAAESAPPQAGSGTL